MSDWLQAVLIVVVLCFALVCFFGAPFVPTRKKWAKSALGLVKLSQRDLVVDLGSGSGTVLAQLARQKVPSIGYELNPILWAISKLRFLTNDLVRVELKNFWLQNLPAKTSVVYVFALERDAAKLEKYLEQQSNEQPLKVITFGFELPTRTPTKKTQGAFLYQF
jgi:hypothetical protein